MKKIDIVGENYRILMSYETMTDQWMIPGGGLESGENECSCCTREVEEETGVLVLPSECVLEIDEYYENCKWVNKYFFCNITGATKTQLTDREKEVGMAPRWIYINEIVNILSKYADYSGIDEMRRGMYLREYTALTSLINIRTCAIDTLPPPIEAGDSSSWFVDHSHGFIHGLTRSPRA